MCYVKYAWVGLTSMSTAVFIYPFLHEGGHALATFATGAKLNEMTVLFFPHTAVQVEATSSLDTILIGIGGMMLPTLIAMFHPKKITTTTMIATLRMINVLAWLLSCVAIFLSKSDRKWEHEDVIVVIEQVRDSETGLSLLCLIMFGFCVYVLFKSNPIEKIASFF